MYDPLAVERDELLRMIGELERLYAALQDVEAGVSNSRMADLRRLRRQVERSKSPSELNSAWKMATAILRAVASELVKLWFETFNYLLAALNSRSGSYDRWGVNPCAARRRWANAA